MSAVFLDTVGLLALWDEADQWHAAAESAFQQVVSQRRAILTTSFVLLECGNAAARKQYRKEVAALRNTLEQRGELIMPTTDDWSNAWIAFDRGDAGLAGIVDQVSFIVMQRLGLREAFTNDRHFKAAGFTTLF